jgi:DNA primase
MPKISEEVINDIIAKTDIVDIIGEQVALSKKGKSYFGLCPFHSEKTPSFSVEPERKIYNCFSCGEKGNPITFLQKTKNLSFVEAVEVLADKANVNIDITKYKKENPYQKLYNINQEAMQFYRLYLSNTKDGIKAQEYLKNRDISDEIIQKFDLGLAPSEYDLLTKTLTNKGVLESDLFDLGLIKQNNNDVFYDLFRKRIIFPIKDDKNQVVAFSGRIYEQSENQPKYINSPQTKVFTKSHVLYNLNNAVQAIKNNDRVVLFEGYMDVIAAYRAGIKESVASMGTSLTQDQVKLMKKYTNNVTICYDGDAAGIEATSRAINMFRNENMDVQIVVLPDALDPDDYIGKYSEEALSKFINEKWLDPIAFEYYKNNLDIDFTKMLDIERFKKMVFDLIKNTSHTIIESYIEKLSKDTNLSIESIRQDFEQYTKRNIRNITARKIQNIGIDNKYVVAERKLINYFIDDVKYLTRFNKEMGDIFYIDERVRDIKHIIEDLYYFREDKSKTSIVIEEFNHALSDEQLQFFEKRIMYKSLELDIAEFRDFLSVMNKYIQKIQKDQWNEQIKVAPTIEEKIKLAEYRDNIIKEEHYG